MKIIKLAIISAVVLFGLITAMASLLPSEIRVSRALDIEAPPLEIAAALRNLRDYKNWNEFLKNVNEPIISGDSLIAPQIKINMQKGGSLQIHSTWMQPDHPALPATYALFPGKSFTTVQWYFTCRFRWYPWEKFSSMVYDKQLGTPMEASLQNLKKLLEQQPSQ
jgi:hypothetical protein